MATLVNESTVAAQPINPGVVRQILLSGAPATSPRVRFDRLTLTAGATAQFNVSAKTVAWLQVLDGEGKLKAVYTDRMSDSHSVLLPPEFNASLSTGTGASVLYAELPDAGHLDPGFVEEPPLFTVVDWRREPVLESKHDARKRVALVTPELCRTTAMRVAMVIYPPGSSAPNYHHEGADSFIYILSGRGTAFANEQPFSVRQGDLIHFAAGERHYLKSADSSEMRFLSFQVPGEFKAVWADPNKVSAWQSTDRDIRGRETAHDEKERRVYQKVFGSPFTR